LIADNFRGKRACGTKLKALLISKKNEHNIISVLLLREYQQYGIRTVKQQWCTYQGRSPMSVRNWIVHIQVVRNNALNVPFQKLP